jgi:hypothetical protein
MGILLFSFLLFSFSAAAGLYDPISVYLTWQRDPSTTMVVQWITGLDRTTDRIEYRKKSETDWKGVAGTHVQMPDKWPYLIHRVELEALEPKTVYEFRAGSDSKVFAFRTMPAEHSEPITFVVGGDIYHDGIQFVEQTNRQAAKLNPHFALLGGDIAYADDRKGANSKKIPRWLEWLASWKNQMVTSDGLLIPMIAVIGNHDTFGRFNQTVEKAPYFYSFFAMPGPQGYNVLDFGRYLSIVILDSGHTHPISGKQTDWLRETLKNRTKIRHKFAIYHVSSYPSVRKFEGKHNAPIRHYWHPVFEEFGIQAVFEHHDHTYKRTFPIRNGKVDPKGVVYLGDGAWGVAKPRTPRKPLSAWYLAKTASARHFIAVKVHPDGHRYFTAIDHQGMVIDEYTQP